MGSVTADRLQQFAGIDGGKHRAKRLLARHPDPAGVAAPDQPEPLQLVLGQISGPLCDRGEAIRVARHRAHREREHRGQRIVAAEALTWIGDVRERGQQVAGRGLHDLGGRPTGQALDLGGHGNGHRTSTLGDLT